MFIALAHWTFQPFSLSLRPVFLLKVYANLPHPVPSLYYCFTLLAVLFLPSLCHKIWTTNLPYILRSLCSSLTEKSPMASYFLLPQIPALYLAFQGCYALSPHTLIFPLRIWLQSNLPISSSNTAVHELPWPRFCCSLTSSIETILLV